MEDLDTFLPGQVAINQKKRNNILNNEQAIKSIQKSIDFITNNAK